MGRLFMFLIAAALTAVIAHFYVTGQGSKTSGGQPPAEAYKQQKEAAKRIEEDGLKRAAEMERKLDPP